MFFRVIVLAALSLTGAGITASGAVITDKTPDVGPYWHPLAVSGTAVYTDSFVFSGATGTMAEVLGVYMLVPGGGAGSQFRLQLWGDLSNSPDPGSVLATTGILQVSNSALQLVTGTLLTPYSMTSGTRYWVAATTVGLLDGLDYQVGAHTQNSIYQDNGTFWYSNDPNGITFDGQGLTPEMAIYVEGGAGEVPEPGTLAMLGAGLGALAMLRRRK